MEPAILAGKASLMYQKFIKPGSFLHIEIPEEIVEEIELVVLDQVNFQVENHNEKRTN